MVLSIIVPAYNEEQRISNTLKSIADLGTEYDFECLIIDDGSIDNTSNIVSDFCKKDNRFRLFRYEKNMGKGFAVAYGIKKSSGEYVLFTDADGSTSIDQVKNFINEIKNGYDMVIGSRRLDASKIEIKQSFAREFLGTIFRMITGFIMPLGVSDSQAGFKLLKRDFALEYAYKQKIYRWAFDVELIALARKLNKKIKELPIIWRNDMNSRVKLSGMVNMLLEIIKIRFYYL